MKPATETLTELLVTALSAHSDFAGIPVLASHNSEERPKPCLLVTSNPEAAPHRAARVIELSLEYLSNRKDTSINLAHRVQETINSYMEMNGFQIATALYPLGWQLSALQMISPYDEPDEGNDWKTGYEYRLVLLQV